MKSCQLNIKDFNTISLKSPASDFTGYQPTAVTLDLEYCDARISVNKNNFVKMSAHTRSQGIGLQTKKNQDGIFGWFFTGNNFPTKQLRKVVTQCGSL